MQRSRNSFWSVLFLVIGAAGVTSPAFANAITFTTVDYDNTANTVNDRPDAGQQPDDRDVSRSAVVEHQQRRSRGWARLTSSTRATSSCW